MNRLVRTRMPGGVGGAGEKPAPTRFGRRATGMSAKQLSEQMIVAIDQDLRETDQLGTARGPTTKVV